MSPFHLSQILHGNKESSQKYFVFNWFGFIAQNDHCENKMYYKPNSSNNIVDANS